MQTHAVQGHSAGRCSGQGEISADCIEGHGEAAETKAAQALSLQGPSMIEYSPARDRDREPGPDIVARHSWAKEEGRASSMLSTSNLNYEGSILSLDNALTRAISTSRGVKGYSNDISAAAGQQLIDDIEMQQDKVRHWLEMEKDRLLGPNPRSGEFHFSFGPMLVLKDNQCNPLLTTSCP